MPTFELSPTMLAGGKFPPQAVRPQTYGYDQVAFLPGDYTAVAFNPLEPAEFVGVDHPRLGTAQLGEVGRPMIGARLSGFELTRTLQLRNAMSCEVAFNWSHLLDSQPIRIRFGSCGNKIHHNHLQRIGPLPAHDVVAIQLSDGLNLDNEISENLILDYTDGIQTTARAGDPPGAAAGLVVWHNRIGITPRRHLADHSMEEPLEQAFDLKSDGTPEDPIRIEENSVFGYRPNRTRTAGQIGSIHDGVTNVVASGNLIAWCEAGWFLKGGTAQRITLSHNLYVDVRHHGFASSWPTKQGSVICGTGGATLDGEHFHSVDRIEEILAAGVPIGAREMIDCVV